ncbi:MAG: MATE family efflux transporter [Planctomycetota bacterium]
MSIKFINKFVDLLVTNKDFYKKYFTYSIPVLVATLLSSILDMIEAIILSRAEPAYIATLNVTSPFFLMTTLIFSSFHVTATALISQYYGENNIEKAKKTAGFLIVISNIFVLTVVTIILLNLNKIVNVLVDKENIQYYAKDYLTIKFIGLIFFFNTNLINTIFRSFLEFYKPFYIMISTVIVNFILDILFIFGYCGFPKMGIRGAAWGYSLSFAPCAGILYILLFTDRNRKPLFSNIVQFGRVITKKVLKILLPALVEPLVIQSAYLLFSAYINRLPLVQITAHRIAIYIESITFIPGFTLSQIIQPIAGYYLGKKDIKGLKKMVILINILIFSFMTTLGILFFIFPSVFSNIFTSNREIHKFSNVCIQIAFFEQPFLAITFVYLNFMRGLGLNKLTLLVSASGVWLVRIPVTYLFIFVLNLDIRYIWFLTIFDWLIRSLLFTLIYNTKSFYSNLLKN